MVDGWEGLMQTAVHLRSVIGAGHLSNLCASGDGHFFTLLLQVRTFPAHQVGKRPTSL
jgi:hypothetical protein